MDCADPVYVPGFRRGDDSSSLKSTSLPLAACLCACVEFLEKTTKSIDYSVVQTVESPHFRAGFSYKNRAQLMFESVFFLQEQADIKNLQALMTNGLIAKKVGMSRIFLEDGEVVPVTYLRVEPNTIVRTKTAEKDGYNAVVLGIQAKKWKTRKGKEHTKFARQKEWKMETLEGVEAGTQVTVESIPAQSVVSITGISKGKGFQGVVKRHGFAGGPASHGSHMKRAPGSIGMKEFPGRVKKGQRMAGRMGGDTVTLLHRSVVISDPEKGILGVKGPIPGSNGSAVFITIESLPEAS